MQRELGETPADFVARATAERPHSDPSRGEVTRGPATSWQEQVETLRLLARLPSSGGERLEPTGGLEPPTYALRVRCSTS